MKSSQLLRLQADYGVIRRISFCRSLLWQKRWQPQTRKLGSACHVCFVARDVKHICTAENTKQLLPDGATLELIRQVADTVCQVVCGRSCNCTLNR